MLEKFLNFDEFLTPKVIKSLLMIAVVLGGISILSAFFLGIGAFLISLVVIPLYICILKMSFEVIMVIFKMKEEIEDLNRKNDETNLLLIKLIEVNKQK